MDANLIGQFCGMPINATLIETGPWIKTGDWLPALTALIVVFLGGVVTFFVTFRIESNRRKYEFKKNAFIDLLGILTELKTIWYNVTNKKISPTKEQLSDLTKRVDVVLYTLRLSGASDKVIEYAERINNADILSKQAEINEMILNQLIPEMKNDLIEKNGRLHFLNKKGNSATAQQASKQPKTQPLENENK